MRVVITGSLHDVCLSIGKIFESSINEIQYVDTSHKQRDLHGLEGRLECARRMKMMKHSYSHQDVYISFQHYFQRTLVGKSFQGYDLMLAIHVFVPHVLDVKTVIPASSHLVNEEILDLRTFYHNTHKEQTGEEFYDEEKLSQDICYKILNIIN